MQTTIFDILYQKFKINKPIRLIELFGGYGSQALALKYLGVEFEHWRLVEWAVKSIQAYKDIHFPDKHLTFSKDRTKQEMVDYLYQKGISANYNEPMTKEQINRLSEEQLKTILENIAITNNLVNIQQVKAEDLKIVDTDNYCYIMCYSFPCQDLSLAGKGKGMSDTSTRSGMLWEVERILAECKELGTLPQVLLMENVPQVHGEGNVEDFNKWQLRLEELGYKNYWEDLIATDYGIPQTRNRCFMVSILGDYSYSFPAKQPLKLKLKDMLENNVDEKYYLSDKQINDIQNWQAYEKPLENMEKTDKNNISPTLTTRSGAYAAGMVLVKDTENYIEWKEKGKLDIDCRASKEDKVSTTICTTPKNKVLIKKPETTKDENVVIKMKKELCNDLIKNNKVKENDVIRHSYSSSRMKEWEKRSVEQNNISPTLDTRCDCLGVVINPLKGTSGKSWQFEQQVYDENGSARTLKASEGSGNIPKVVNDLRIRKLTPNECFRLMGVKDEDYEKCAKNQSNASLYHLAGDSIVVNVLMAIFKELL